MNFKCHVQCIPPQEGSLLSLNSKKIQKRRERISGVGSRQGWQYGKHSLAKRDCMLYD